MKNEDNENRRGAGSIDTTSRSDGDVEARRSMIEHTRNIELSELEIIARKKAHADRRAEQEKKKKSGANKKKKNTSQKARSTERSGSSGKASRSSKASFEKARNGSNGKRDVIGKAKPAAEPRTGEAYTEPVGTDNGQKKQTSQKTVSKKSAKKEQPKSEQTKKSAAVREQAHFKPVEKPGRDDPEKQKNKKSRRADSEETVDMQDFRKRRKRLKMKKRLKRLVLVLVLVIIAAVIYFTRGMWVPKLEGILEKPRETIVNDGVMQAGNYPIDLSESTLTGVTSFDGRVVTLDGSHFTVYDPNGKVRETVFHMLGSPVARSSGKRMLLFDNGSDTLKLYGRNGLIFEKKLDATIVYGAIASNGSVLAVTIDDKLTARLTVFDKNGRELYKWANGDRIMDASFDSRGESFTVATFSVADGRMTSKITRVELEDEHRIMTSEEIDGLVIRAAENSSGNIWAMTRDKLFVVSDVGRVTGSYEFPSEPVSFDLCSDCVCAVTRQITGGQMVISVFDAQSDTAEPKVTTPASGVPGKVKCYDSMAFVLSSGRLDAYAPDGSLAATAAVTNDYTDFVYCENAVYLFGSREMNKIVFKIK